MSSPLHYAVYAVHDVSSLAVLAASPLSFSFGFRATVAIPLAVSLLSGWILVGYRVKQRTAKGHLTLTEVVTSCIVNQGLAVMVLGWLLLASPIPHEAFVAISAAVALHALYCTVRCLRLYRAESAVQPVGKYSETTLQLIYMVSAPNVVLFLALASGLVRFDDRVTLSIWLLFECLPGIVFSIAHDKRWLWPPTGLSRSARHAVCQIPYAWLCAAYLVL